MIDSSTSRAAKFCAATASRAYAKPTVTFLGSFSSLTRAMNAGPYADQMGGVMLVPMTPP